MIKQKEGKEKGKEDEDDIIQKAKEELNYINGVLENDGKNYHVVRSLLTRKTPSLVETSNPLGKSSTHLPKYLIITPLNLLTFQHPHYLATPHKGMVTSPMDYVHKLILDDPRNNSAWNHRWFITHKGCTRKPLSSLEDVQKEITYAMQCAEVDPFNESPWRYVIGFLEECKKYSGSEGNEQAECRPGSCMLT
eukprot:15365965-Ditylum_brightwellii.AAC.2